MLRTFYQRPVFASLAVGLLAVSAFATKPFWYLPHPTHASRTDLLRWIALRDVGDYPRELQVSLVDGLEAQVDPAALSATAEPNALVARFAARIQQNAEVLKRVWFESRCERYADCPSQDRIPYLLERIDVLLGWSEVLDAARPPAAQAKSFLDDFTQEVGTWIAAAPDSTRGRMETAVRDAIVCWLATRDVAEESLASQQSLARILHDHLTSPAASNEPPPLPLNSEQQSRLRANGMLLIKAWLREQAARFDAAEPEGRVELLDQCLESVYTCSAHPYLQAAPGDATATSLPAALAELPAWIESVEPEERPRLASFLQQLQGRVMARFMRGLWGK